MALTSHGTQSVQTKTVVRLGDRTVNTNSFWTNRPYGSNGNLEMALCIQRDREISPPDEGVT